MGRWDNRNSREYVSKRRRLAFYGIFFGLCTIFTWLLMTVPLPIK